MKKKLVLVYGRQGFGGLPLYQLPVLKSLVLYLQPFYESIELILFEYNRLEDYKFLGRNVKVTFLGDYRLRGRYRYDIFVLLASWKLKQAKSTTDVILGGPFGLLCAKAARQNKNIDKVLYFDDEFLWVYYQKLLPDAKAKELLTYCDGFIGLDAMRNDRVIEYYDLKPRNIFVLPNTVDQETATAFKEIDWIKRADLNPNYKYVIYAGWYGALLKEILTTVPLWPSNVGFILHNFSEEDIPFHKHLFNERVFLTKGYLDDAEYNSLLRFCIASTGLYPLDHELELVGMSSGKIMRSISQGVPVIASSFKSLKFIKDNNWAVLVDHPIEMPDAINKVLSQKFSKGEEFYFETHANKIKDFMVSKYTIHD